MELAEFDQIYLEDSYVLELIENTTKIEFKLNLVLRENHRNYTAPKEGEQYCYKQGSIVFKNPAKVTWIKKEFRPTKDPDGEIDFGNIDYFIHKQNKYFLGGEWGEVQIESNPPSIVYQ